MRGNAERAKKKILEPSRSKQEDQKRTNGGRAGVVISLINTPRGPSFSEVRKNKKKLSKKKTKKHTHVTVRFLKPTVMATRDDNRSSKNEKTRSKKQTMDQFVRTGM